MYSRTLNDQPLTLAPSGWTYGEDVGASTFVLADKETESLWFPMTFNDCCALVCIAGPLADWRLDGLMRMERTSWAQWADKHPDTLFVTE